MSRKPMSEETKAKIAASLAGKKKSRETRAKMTEAAKDRWEDLDYQRKQRKAQVAAHTTPEALAKASEYGKRAHEGSK